MNLRRAMSPRRRMLAACWLISTATCALGQGKIDTQLMQRYGGVLAPDCFNYTLPQLKYLGDSLVVQDGGKVILTGRNVKAAPNYFGVNAPPEFETALTSQVANGEALVFVFYRSASGLFAAVEGGPKVVAALPAALRNKRVRHCDPNRNMAPGAAAPVTMNPPDLLKDASFRQRYLQALGPLARESWLARMDGPAPALRNVQVAGHDYQLASVCKNHDCNTHNMVLLYSASARAIYAKVVQGGRSTLLGSPPAPVAQELDRLWKAEWRAGK